MSSKIYENGHYTVSVHPLILAVLKLYLSFCHITKSHFTLTLCRLSTRLSQLSVLSAQRETAICSIEASSNKLQLSGLIHRIIMNRLHYNDDLLYIMVDMCCKWSWRPIISIRKDTLYISQTKLSNNSDLLWYRTAWFRYCTDKRVTMSLMYQKVSTKPHTHNSHSVFYKMFIVTVTNFIHQCS